MRKLALKLIRKYKKVYSLSNWDVVLEISPTLNTMLLSAENNHSALLIINKIDSKLPIELEEVIKRELKTLKGL